MTHGPRSRENRSVRRSGTTSTVLLSLCTVVFVFCLRMRKFPLTVFAHAQAPSNSGSYYIQGNEMNCEGSSEYMIMFMSFTRASFLTYGRISHPVC